MEMDEPLKDRTGYPCAMYLQEGFFGQRVRVLPRPVVKAAQSHPIVRRLLVTDAGYFPHAAMHGRLREHGARETIVMVCTDGAGWVEVEEQNPVPVKRGDAVVLAPAIRHRYQADRQDPWTIWWVHVTGEDTDDFVAAILKDGAGPVVPLRDVYSAVQSLEEAVSALEEEVIMAMLVIAAGAAWRVLAQIAASRMHGADATHDRIRHVQEYLRNNLDTTYSVPELAAMAGLSTSHFSALFRNSAETSVKDYLKRLRSARARELLLMTEMPVSQVSVAVGYDDALYFSRQFRSVNGVSPSEFRRLRDFEPLAPAGSHGDPALSINN